MTHNNYDSISYCMNILFDYYYNVDTADCYKFEKIANNSITIEDIKKPATFIAKDILAAGFTYKGQLGGQHMFVRKSDDDVYEALVYIGRYGKDVDRSSLTLRENNGPKISYILSELAAHDPFIVLPIMNFDVTGKELEKLNSNIFKVVGTNGTKDDVYYIHIKEHFNKLEPLSKYLKERKEDNYYRIILFHVLFALYKITKKYPNFSHNKLNLDNVFIHHRPGLDPMQHFEVNNTVFNVPNLGFEVKLDNFEDAFITEGENNQFFDIHYFMTHLMNTFQDLPKPLETFYKSIIPDDIAFKGDLSKFDGFDRSIKMPESTSLTASSILTKNNFFIDFIKGTEMSESPVSNNSKNVNSIESTDSTRFSYIRDSNSENSITHKSDEPLHLAKKSGHVYGSRKITNMKGGAKKTASKKKKNDSSTSSTASSSSTSSSKSGSPSSTSSDMEGTLAMSFSSEGNGQRGGSMDSILKQLPEGFSGALPDWMQQQLTTQNAAAPDVNLANYMTPNGVVNMNQIERMQQLAALKSQNGLQAIQPNFMNVPNFGQMMQMQNVTGVDHLLGPELSDQYMRAEKTHRDFETSEMQSPIGRALSQTSMSAKKPMNKMAGNVTDTLADVDTLDGYLSEVRAPAKSSKGKKNFFF